MTNKSVRWCFNFAKWNPSYSDILLSTSCIQQEEKIRLMKFVFKENFKSSLAGRLMMRKFVSEALHLPYNLIKFVRDEKDKPFVSLPEGNFSKICFNVSHQGNYTVFSGEMGNDIIGCDVMKLEYTGGKSLPEFFRIMTRNFSPDEWSNIKSFSSEREQLNMFCRHWCLKESYVKALGVGITISLQDISFKIHTKSLIKNKVVKDTELFIKGEKQNWLFEECLIDEEHCAAVALPNEESIRNRNPILFEEINFDELIRNYVPILEKDEEYCNAYFKKLDKP